ncbi:hypothetical protein E2C01_090023 [Portunus trituberculatus]|uniref:Uncharacterized protein n=1 Tax=Portunus trituberculatus TaxID=210409 RepID=A0A5B7JKT8_PORTR|nr:hypothetical protein [Portunus trituberculatus]
MVVPRACSEGEWTRGVMVERNQTAVTGSAGVTGCLSPQCHSATLTTPMKDQAGLSTFFIS